MIAFICDLDGTIADLSHRLHFIEGEKKDWDGFFGAMGKDKLIVPVAKLVRLLNKEFPVIYVSGRPHKYQEDIFEWLGANDLPMGLLLNRADGDHRPDDKVKQEIYRKKIKPRFNIQFVLDDRDRVVEMWRNEGLLCLQVAKGEF